MLLMKKLLKKMCMMKWLKKANTIGTSRLIKNRL